MKKVMQQKNWTLIGFVLFVVCMVPVFFLDNPRQVGTFWAFIAALAATVFVVAYGLLANWRRNPDGSRNQAGQHLMTFTVVIGAVMWLVVASRFGLIPPEWSPFLSYAIYLAVAFLLIWRLILLIVVQVRARRKRRAKAADGNR
jgi:MFS family permease